MTELVEHGQLFIGGELADPPGPGRHRGDLARTPSRSSAGCRTPRAADVDRAVAAARTAFDEGPWPRTPLDERIEVVTRIKDAIAVRHEEIARVISSENGSPVLLERPRAGARRDDGVGRGDHGRARLHRTRRRRDGVLGPLLVRREPVGVVAAVVPWNVPQFVAAAKLAPALLAGCSVVLKPSPGDRRWTRTCSREIADGGRAAGGRAVDPARRTARSASTWSGTRASTRSPSPARWRRASASWRSRPAISPA